MARAKITTRVANDPHCLGDLKPVEGSPAYWAEYALQVAHNGFGPVVVKAGTKEPRYPKWNAACYRPPDLSFIVKHATRRANDSVGIACGILREGEKRIGYLIAIDCDASTQSRSAEIRDKVVAHLGETPLIRFGRRNRFARFYRSAKAIGSYRVDDLEILGIGRQVLGFGTHPNTGQPYQWQDGSPADVRAAELPVITRKKLEGLLREFGGRAAARPPYCDAQYGP